LVAAEQQAQHSLVLVCNVLAVVVVVDCSHQQFIWLPQLMLSKLVRVVLLVVLVSVVVLLTLMLRVEELLGHLLQGALGIHHLAGRVVGVLTTLHLVRGT
jgi:hypothetical protein